MTRTDNPPPKRAPGATSRTRAKRARSEGTEHPRKHWTTEALADDLFSTAALLEALSARIQMLRLDDAPVDYDALGMVDRVVRLATERVTSAGTISASLPPPLYIVSDKVGRKNQERLAAVAAEALASSAAKRQASA